jgi:predicted metal-dependent peptidase
MSNVAAAAGKMHIVTQRMVAKYPFHASLVSAAVFVAEPVKTMAVTIRDGALTFIYDPAFVAASELDVLIGSLLHEVGHVLADHLVANPADYPDRRARTIAEEVTVNESIIEPLPPGVLRIDQFNLPADEDTDERYRRLAGRKKPRAVRKPARRGQKNAPHGKKKPSPRRDSTDSVQTLDDHSFWEAPRKTPERTRDVIDRAVVAAADRLADAERAALAGAVRQRVHDARIRLMGPSASTEAVGKGIARIRWEQILEQFSGRRRDAAATFRRPSRRFPALAGIVPAYVYPPTKLRIIGVIDTSGSMESGTLAVISAELEALAREHEVTVVQCDDRIRSVAPFAGPIKEIVGRGATDFRPPLEAQFLGEHRPDVVVYFCDGAGAAPVRAPRVPVIWAITAGGLRPTSWGQFIWLRSSGS